MTPACSGYSDGVRRAGLAAFLSACGVAGALLAVLAAGPSSAASGTETTASATIPPGVTISGLQVGGMSRDAAYAIVRTAFEAPLAILAVGHRLEPTPQSLGAIGYVQNAVDRALVAPPGTDVPLMVHVDGRKVRAYVKAVAGRFDRKSVDARVVLRKLKPFLTQERNGRSLDRIEATDAIVAALRTNARVPIVLPFENVRPTVTRRTFGRTIVIRRGQNRLYLYRSMRLERAFSVATGSERYPTPLGRFEIRVMWKHPWWYPPDSDWARGQSPIPPGPGNPLGTRWMGLTSPSVGIHGTPDPASLGYSVSHGCIRMAIPDAEWMFERVKVGTTVFIVRQ
jgi:lipoprotein-anchoring transpeptidase ErfK/SrfK